MIIGPYFYFFKLLIVLNVLLFTHILLLIAKYINFLLFKLTFGSFWLNK